MAETSLAQPKMKLAQKLLLAAAVVAFVVLLRKLDARAVWAMVAGVGWWFALILPVEGGCHVLNAQAWKLSFPSAEARGFPLGELFRLRVVGDAVNYLTPTATLGGEVTRAGMLNASASTHARNSSVVVAKFSQMVAQIAFVLAGFLLFVSEYLPVTAQWALIRKLAGGAFALGLAAYVGYALFGRRWISAGQGDGLRPALKRYFRDHPWRLGASMALFTAGYAWSAIESWLICRAIGAPVGWGLAIAIETLSIGIDAVLLVPGKVGTQESGKTAVFALLGQPPAAGFAFGVIRHVRELAWSVAGLALARRGGRLEETARTSSPSPAR